jgi:hypothetical protein
MRNAPLKKEGNDGRPIVSAENSGSGYEFRTMLLHCRGALEIRPAAIIPCLLICLTALLCSCASPQKAVSQGERHFDFQKDTFAFPNELVWEYFYDDKGNWTSKRRSPAPDYWLHCFVLARSTRQFFLNARFEPQWPPAGDKAYKRLIHRVVSSNPRKSLPEEEKVVIPGYPDLRTFSQDHAELLKAECGSAWESYVQRSHWRMLLPFTRHEQSNMAEQLVEALKPKAPIVVHVVRFPQLSINHALVLYDVQETEREIQFTAYDPNQPEGPTTLTYERDTRTFLLPANHYFPGGRIDVYEIYHKWDY